VLVGDPKVNKSASLWLFFNHSLSPRINKTVLFCALSDQTDIFHRQIQLTSFPRHSPIMHFPGSVTREVRIIERFSFDIGVGFLKKVTKNPFFYDRPSGFPKNWESTHRVPFLESSVRGTKIFRIFLTVNHRRYMLSV
jgi:hypothetical protein